MVSHNGSMGAAEQGCALTSCSLSFPNATNARPGSRRVQNGAQFSRLCNISHGSYGPLLDDLLHIDINDICRRFDDDRFHPTRLLYKRYQVVMYSCHALQL
jgi:hypothetical protein